MEFTMRKDIDEYSIEEQGRCVFRSSYEKEGGLLSIYLKNMYGDDIMGFYQLRKWYSRFRPCMDFTVYEGDEQIGELKKSRDGYELIYHDVYYRFYCGMHAGRRVVICFDRAQQIAEFVLDDISTLRFKSTTQQALLSLLCVLMKAFLDQEQFSQEAFLHHYIGVYNDASATAA